MYVKYSTKIGLNKSLESVRVPRGQQTIFTLYRAGRLGQSVWYHIITITEDVGKGRKLQTCGVEMIKLKQFLHPKFHSGFSLGFQQFLLPWLLFNLGRFMAQESIWRGLKIIFFICYFYEAKVFKKLMTSKYIEHLTWFFT